MRLIKSTRPAVPVAPDPATPDTTRVDLTCHAPHGDPKRKGEACGAILQRGAPQGVYEFITTAKRAPSMSDGHTWLRCATCRWWSSFSYTRPATLVPTTIEAVIERHLQKLPENQQIAAIMLGQGFNNSQAAREIGVDRSAVGKWAKRPEFTAAREAIAAKHRVAIEQTGTEFSRVAMTALFDVIESDRERGVAHNAKWFLSRTVFRDLELMRASAGSSGGTNVSVTVAQSQQNMQSAITSVWEKRRASLTGAAVVADPK